MYRDMLNKYFLILNDQGVICLKEDIHKGIKNLVYSKLGIKFDNSKSDEEKFNPYKYNF